MEFEWNIFPGFNTLQLCVKVKDLLSRLGETPENFTGRVLFMSMFNDISCGSKDNEKECLANVKLVSLYARRFGKGQWSFIGPGSEKKWYCISEDSPQGVCDNMAERMLLVFAESDCPIFRATSPLSRGRLKKQRTWKTVDTLCSRPGNDWDYFSHNCFCKPAQSLRSSRGDMWRVWIPSRENGATRCDGTIKFLTRAQCDQDRSSFGQWWHPAYQNFLLQQYGERIEKLSQQDKLSKFCIDAGFLNVVEIGQYFVTKDTAEFSQFHAVACREYTLPREDEASQPIGWIQGNTQIGPILEVATSYFAR